MEARDAVPYLTVHRAAPCLPTKKDAEGIGPINVLRGSPDGPGFVSDCV